MKTAALVVVLACATAAAVGAPRSASAAETHSNCATFDDQGNIISLTPSCSETISVQGGDPQSMPGLDPCTGDTGTLTISFTHQVFHVNVDRDGDLWITGTQNGTLAFVPDDPSAPSGTGSWASWFGGSVNNRNSVMTDTFDAEAHLTTGQTATLHEVDHVTITGTGTISTEFSKGSALTGGDCH